MLYCYVSLDVYFIFYLKPIRISMKDMYVHKSATAVN